MSFWERITTGAVAAAVWNLFRNPGSCACCVVLLVILALVNVLVAVALPMAAWQYALIAAVAIGVALVIREARR